jgi:hypothetical protein
LSRLRDTAVTGAPGAARPPNATAIAVSRSFLSHSSANNDQAVALYGWLQREGWRDEVFLDLDPIRAILREVLMNEKDPCIGNSRRGPRA